jgi:hypothetical protein
MALAGEHLGETMRWVPDGETGERFHWVINIVEAMRRHPDLELAREGKWTDYKDVPEFKVRRGHTLTAESLDFGHVAAFRESYPSFQAMKAERGDDSLTFQVGIPGDLDMTAFVVGPKRLLRYRKIFHAATVGEVRRIHELAGSDVIFQIEVPLELVFVARARGPLRPLAARMLGGGIAKIAADSPAGTRFGVHLCLGDMNHKALVGMKDMSPVVALANACAAHWPSGRTLEFMHAPFAGASQPPPTQEAYYAPLSKLKLPTGTRFVAGFVYEHQPLEEQAALLRTIERFYGSAVDVSASCGLGRRSPEEAVASMDHARQLAQM